METCCAGSANENFDDHEKTKGKSKSMIPENSSLRIRGRYCRGIVLVLSATRSDVGITAPEGENGCQCARLTGVQASWKLRQTMENIRVRLVHSPWAPNGGRRVLQTKFCSLAKTEYQKS